MGRNRWQLRRQAALLVMILVVDGALLGATAGIVRHGQTSAHAAAGAAGSEASRGWAEYPADSGEVQKRAEQPADSGEAQSQSRTEGLTEKVIALTFDDGPHEECTARLLDGLKERGVKATFFLMGQNIEGKEELVRRMQEEGHLIGNHGYEHVQMTKAGQDAVCQAVDRTGAMIAEITGQAPHYLRPPYGDWNEDLECRMDVTTVFWTLDSLDWKLKNTGKIVRQVEKQVKEGDIILMHDIFPTSVEAALLLVDRLQEKGFRFVTVDELAIE